MTSPFTKSVGHWLRSLLLSLAHGRGALLALDTKGL